MCNKTPSFRWMSAATHAGRLKALLSFALFTFAFSPVLSADTFAQSGTFATQLTLKETKDQYDLSPYIYVTPDSSKTLTYKAVVDRHLAGMRGNAVKGNVLNLGSSRVPHWVIVGINNESDTEKWMLSFGQHLNGRVGLYDEIFVYDHVSRKNFMHAGSSPQATGGKHSAAVPVTIPKASRALLVIYVIPKPGMASTMALELVTERVLLSQLSNPGTPGGLAKFLFITLIGFFTAAIFFRRMWSGGLFVAYYLLQLVLFEYQNDAIYTETPFANQAVGVLFGLCMIVGLMITKAFFGITRAERTQNRLIFFVAGIVLLASLVATFILPPSMPLWGLAMFGPSLLAILFMTLLSMAQGYLGKYAAYQFGLAWLFLFIGALVTFMTTMGMLSASSHLVAAYWYSLLPQGILFITAVATRFIRFDAENDLQKQEVEQEEENVEEIVQTKEVMENARLKRLIEHEKQVMQELREREIAQNEEMRKAKDAADEANRAKSAFLAVISHEIRTPMTGVMGMVRLLLDTQLSKQQLEYSTTIQDSGDAMLSLLNDILDFEKIESGKMDLERVDFDVHRIINGIVTLMSGHADNKGIYLKANIDPAVNRYMVGDPVRLRQVLLNLAGNSIKFTTQGGVTINVTAEPASGKDKGRAQKVKFAVQDTGIGISKEAQRSLFNPFAQADSSISRKFGGTGLGLAISQRLIESMGGKILIDSIEGNGSTFYFIVTLEEGDSQAATDTRGSGRESLTSKPQKVMNILIVEDNQINQKLLKEFVERMGHTTALAGTGEEAVEKVKTSAFDMVLMDLELPGISGMGATKAIRALPDADKAGVPIIALTGNVRDEDIRACFAANMNGHLEKPVDPMRIKQMIEKVINGKLDNPVILGDRSEGFLKINKIETKPTVTPAPVSVPTPTPAPAVPEEQGENDHDVSPLRRMVERDVREEATTLTAQAPLTSAELEEDSFLIAADVHKIEMASGEIFDPATLTSLRGSMPPNKFRELFDGLVQQTNEIVARMEQAVAANDLTATGARAHEIKGMAGNFGLKDLSLAAARLEDAAKAGNQAAIVSLMAAIRESHNNANIVLAGWISQ